MKELISIDCNNKIEVIELLARLSELVKCTLGGFGSVYKAESIFISTKNFEYRFEAFLPKEFENIDELPYEKMFSGKNSIILAAIYRQLLNVFFQIGDFRIPPTSEPKIGYSTIENELRQVDKELDLLIEKITL